jgi:hypothetical protein
VPSRKEPRSWRDHKAKVEPIPEETSGSLPPEQTDRDKLQQKYYGASVRKRSEAGARSSMASIVKRTWPKPKPTLAMVPVTLALALTLTLNPHPKPHP